jgi:AraC-like DNA-binding protein
MEPILYKLQDYTSNHFPFQLRVRDHTNFNLSIHAHDQFQVCYVRKGTCKNRVGDNEAVLVKGDLFSIPPFLEHSLTLLPNNDIELVQIDFSPAFINESMQDLSTMNSFVDFTYLQPIMASGDKLLPKLNMSSANQIKVEQLIAGMQEELREKDEGYTLAIRADLLRLLIIAGREFRNFVENRKEGNSIHIHRRAFFDTVEYIKMNFHEEIKLDAVAEMATMAPSYFSHMFKFMMGVTLTEYLNNLRIHKAMELLRLTDISVLEIQLHVGFNHSGHFTRMFKKIAGMTPMQYRKQT